MQKETQNQKEETEEVLENLEKSERSQKIKKLFIIAIISVLLIIIIFISFAFYKYFQTPEKTLGLGANIESSLLSADGKTAYIKLAGGSLDKNITKIKFIFKDAEGKEFVYETSEGTQEISVPFKRSFWDWLFGRQFERVYDYEISSSDLELDDFSNINEVSVSFEYKTETGEIIETPVLDTTKTTTAPPTISPGGGGGPSGPGTEPTPPTCTDSDTGINYSEKGTASYSTTTNEDYCSDNILNEYYCNNAIIEEINYNCSLEGKVCLDGRCVATNCTNDTGCSSVRSFCDGSMPFNCSLNISDGCLDRANKTECILPEQCVGGSCQLISENTFYVSVTGAGSHNGTLGNEMNLTNAQVYANLHLNNEITFLMESGNYGAFSLTNTPTRDTDKWVTWKANGNVVFERIYIKNSVARDTYLKFDGINIQHPVYTPTDDGHWHNNDVGAPGFLVSAGNVNYLQFLNGHYIGSGRWISNGLYLRPCSHLLIQHCEVENFTGTVFDMIGDNIEIRNCYAHDFVDASGIRIQGDVTFALFENNHLFCAPINKTEAYYPWWEKINNPSSIHPGSGFSIRSSNIIIRNNTVHGPFAQGLMFYSPYTYHNMIVENNLFYDTGPVRIDTLDGSCIVRNNTGIGYIRDTRTTSMGYIQGRYIGQPLNVGLYSINSKTTNIAANKLIDINATDMFGGFISMGVKAGVSSVANTAAKPYTYALVTGVDSETQLTLSNDIFNASGQNYGVYIFDGTGVDIRNNVVVGYWSLLDPRNPYLNYTEDYNIIWRGPYNGLEYGSAGKGANTKVLVYKKDNVWHGWPNFFEDTGFKGITPEYDYSRDGIQPFFVDPNYWTGMYESDPWGWGRGKIWDYHPLMSSPICNGGYINGVKVLQGATLGVAWAGALPCVDVNILSHLSIPGNDYWSNKPEVSLSCLAITTTDKLANLTIYAWNSAGLLNKTTKQLTRNLSEPLDLTLYGLSEYNLDSYKWNCLAVNSKGQEDWYDMNYTFNIDTTYPLIEFGPKTPSNDSALQQSNIYFDVNYVEDNFYKIYFKLYNSTTMKLVNDNIYYSKIYEINWTNLKTGDYFYEAIITDKAGNYNSTGLRKITLNTGMSSFSPFTQLLNFLKGLLTRETGKAILTGKTITGDVIKGNAVNEANENWNFKVPYIILSILAVIILIIAVIIVKIKKKKKKSGKKEVFKKIKIFLWKLQIGLGICYTFLNFYKN